MNRLFLSVSLLLLALGTKGQSNCPTPGSILAQVPGGEAQSVSFIGDGAPLSIDLELVFIDPSSQGSWAADMALFITAPNGVCVQMGGYNYVPDTNCTELGNYTAVWPSWDTSNSGSYSASVDLQGTGLAGSGTWTIAVMNGYISASNPVVYDLAWDFVCVIDTVPPTIEISQCPGDTVLVDFCNNENIPGPGALGFPNFYVQDDACSDEVQLDVSVNEQIIGNCAQDQDGQPEGGFTLLRTFTALAMDCAGNQASASCSHTIHFVDTEAPLLEVTCPDDYSISLDENCQFPYSALAPSMTGDPFATAEDACDSQVQISINFYDHPPTDNPNNPGFSFERQWFISATDDCGNTTAADCFQYISIDPGGCVKIPGCTYPEAANFNPTATEDDGSCDLVLASPCPTDVDGNGTTDTQDLILLLGSFSLVCVE